MSPVGVHLVYSKLGEGLTDGLAEVDGDGDGLKDWLIEDDGETEVLIDAEIDGLED